MYSCLLHRRQNHSLLTRSLSVPLHPPLLFPPPRTQQSYPLSSCPSCRTCPVTHAPSASILHPLITLLHHSLFCLLPRVCKGRLTSVRYPRYRNAPGTAITYANVSQAVRGVQRKNSCRLTYMSVRGAPRVSYLPVALYFSSPD